MEEIYGEQPPIQMISRFESEKAGLQDTDFIVFADFIGELASMCNREYGDIFNLGELESSFAAWLLGATKCNPLPAHYYCPKCRKVEFVPTVGCCWDLPEKKCECGETMVRDGIDVTDRSMILTMCGNTMLYHWMCHCRAVCLIRHVRCSSIILMDAIYWNV